MIKLRRYNEPIASESAQVVTFATERCSLHLQAYAEEVFFDGSNAAFPGKAWSNYR